MVVLAFLICSSFPAAVTYISPATTMAAIAKSDPYRMAPLAIVETCDLRADACKLFPLLISTHFVAVLQFLSALCIAFQLVLSPNSKEQFTCVTFRLSGFVCQLF